MDTGNSETLTSTVQSDDQEECMSPQSSGYNSGDLMAAAMGDEVMAQLAAAGPAGMAAAAAIVSAKKRKKPYNFEMNPSRRKRQQNRLLKKLTQTVNEFSTRVGQQAVVLVATPGKTNSFKCFGTQPLEGVVKNFRPMIIDELEVALAQQAPPPVEEDPTLQTLPPLIVEGIPTPVEKMTQEQLRAFIPLMLKYSTGRGKPGWGRESTRPPWWPKEVPWENIRIDARSEIEKHKTPWTQALRQIVFNCYKYHNREDLLPAFSEEDEKKRSVVFKVLGGLKNSKKSPTSSFQVQDVAQYAQAVLQTISNPDGTVSIIQVNPNNPIITLPDGSVGTIHTGQVEGSVHAIQTLVEGQGDSIQVDLNNVQESLNQEGQLILTGEDGRGYPVSVSGMITVPVSSSMYQTVVANLQQIHTQNDGTIQVVHVPKVDASMNNHDTVTLDGATHQLVTVSADSEPQVLQVISLKDIKTEDVTIPNDQS